jgi:hypothetical protein
MNQPLLRKVLGYVALFCLIGFPGAAAADLVGHWPLDETSGTTATEVVGGKDGTLVNFPGDDSQWQSGMIGGALRFDGNNDFVTHGFNLPRTQGTLAHWVKPTDSGTSIIYYESDFPNSSGDYNGFNSGGPVLEIHTLWDDDRFCFIYEDEDVQDAGSNVNCNDEGAQIDEWNHVAVTWDTSGDYVMYINCQEVGRESLAGLTFAGKTTTDAFFGRPSESTRFFEGLLDDVRVYDTILSPTEISSFCGGGGQGLGVPVLGWPGILVLSLLTGFTGIYLQRKRAREHLRGQS